MPVYATTANTKGNNSELHGQGARAARLNAACMATLPDTAALRQTTRMTQVDLSSFSLRG